MRSRIGVILEKRQIIIIILQVTICRESIGA